MKNLNLMPFRFDVADLAAQLDVHPELWNQHTARTENPASPHFGLDDIWVRFNNAGNYDPSKGLQRFADEHQSEWYPCVEQLPAARALIDSLLEAIGGGQLGGVLITRIPSGRMCRPHRDSGWHAESHDKYAVQIKSAPGQEFCFVGESLDAKPGDVYTFNNLETHWVVNPTEHERITLIVCVRHNRGAACPA
ncbi:MAG: aspartyl/asparaginyl beta-hydroxylase domain-containing protein [Chryseolinea sp.]